MRMVPADRNVRSNAIDPPAVLAGGERSVIVATAALLAFFNTKGAAVLRAASFEFRDAVAAYPWDDQSSGCFGYLPWQV